MLFHRYCIYIRMGPPKLPWNIYIFYNIIVSINVYICMCSLTTTVMTFFGMLGLLALGIPPARILIGRCWVIHDPSLRHLQWSFQISIICFLGSLGHQLSSFLSLGCIPWQRSTLVGVGQNMSPTLCISSGLSSSCKNKFPPMHSSCFYLFSNTHYCHGYLTGPVLYCT